MMSTRKKRIKPVEEATSFILLSKDKPGIEGKYIDSEKGRGVFATQPIEPGAFVVEYKGDLISVEECQSRQYSETESTFLFEFEWQKHRYCIDASKEDGSLGRLVNDDNKSPNCTIKQIAVNNRPHLCLFAVKKIEIGTEIDYSYGDSKWPWRNKVPISQSPAVEVEYKKLPAAEDTSPNVSDFADNVGTQVPINQSPAVEVESKKLPAAEDTSPNVSDFADNVGTQVPISQSLAVEVESKKLPAAEDTSPNMSNFADNVGTQVFTSQATSLVDYSDSDDSMEVAPEKLDSESDSSGSLNHSDSTFVDETDDPDSLKAHSSEQSYFVPKLRRTKSILTPIGSDDSSADSEDDYIPHPSEESTESDGLELSMKAKAKKKSTSAVKNRKTVDIECSQKSSQEMEGSEEDMDGSQEKEGCPKSCRRGEPVDIECSQKSSQEMEGSEEDMDCSQEKEDACETEAEGRESARKRGKKTVQKRSWTQEESAAVERHLGKFMRRNKVPGKRDCESCIAAESEVLETRDWKAVKYFIKNRISAMRRKLQ